MSELWRWSARETAQQVAAGAVSSREVSDPALPPTAEVEPKLKTLSEVTEQIALGAADAVDQALMRLWSTIFTETTVFVMPKSYRHARKVDADQGDDAWSRQLFDDQSPLLATVLMGHPELQVPTGPAADGAPIGVQLAARWWDEGTLLAAGQVIEDAMGPITAITPAW